MGYDNHGHSLFCQFFDNGNNFPHQLRIQGAIQTPLGEVYYGLTSSVYFEGEKVFMTMESYNQDYYLDMNKDFVLPGGIEFDEDNKPVMAVPGLKSTTGFRI